MNAQTHNASPPHNALHHTMNKPALLSSICLALAALFAAGGAQAQSSRVYRCGNEYTNQLKGRKDCHLVEGGNITIVRSLPPVHSQPRRIVPRSGVTPSSGGSGTTTASSGGGGTRITSPEQAKRDSDARAILEQELRRAETRQAELLREYNNGQPERLGSERNYQKYLDRTAELKASIDRNQADIEGIKRELSRFK